VNIIRYRSKQEAFMVRSFIEDIAELAALGAFLTTIMLWAGGMPG
jgi:hypothetical protein